MVSLSKAAKKTIPRGVRRLYIPCMTEESAALLDEYEKIGDPDIADHLIESLDAARRARWEETTAHMNFTHSNWKLVTDTSSWCCTTTSKSYASTSVSQCHSKSPSSSR